MDEMGVLGKHNEKELPLVTALNLRMERAMGIEPTSVAWEAAILPMNYARERYARYCIID